MKVERLAVDSLHHDPSNVRKHDERNVKAIAASLQRFGQQKPIVVDSEGIVRAGNGTLEAAKSLGWADIAAVRTDLESAEAVAYAIADNRTAELAEWDEEGLALQLDALDKDLLDATGYDAKELQAIIDDLDPGSETYPGQPERGPRSVTMVMSHEQGAVFDEAMSRAKGQGQGEKTANICAEWLS